MDDKSTMLSFGTHRAAEFDWRPDSPKLGASGTKPARESLGMDRARAGFCPGPELWEVGEPGTGIKPDRASFGRDGRAVASRADATAWPMCSS